MSSKTALPIARLRALGCKVSTVIGHDPAIADFIYSVTLPDGIIEDETWVGVGLASVEVRNRGRRLIVKACSYRMRQPIPTREQSRNNAADVAETLTLIANEIERI